METTKAPARKPAFLPLNKGLRELIAPHRSYRKLPVNATGALITIPIVIAIEIGVVLIAPYVLRAMAWYADLMATKENIAIRGADEHWLFVTIHPASFTMRHMTFVELLILMAVCAVGLVLFSFWTKPSAPLRFFLNLNFCIIAGGAIFLYLFGHLGYDSATFSRLLLRTSLLTWLILPVFVGLFASLFPFSLMERIGFILITVAYDFPLSILRYGVFVGILGKLGPVMMPDLYLVFGPLLDAVPIICVFAIFLVKISKDMDNRKEVWQWL